MTPLENLKSMLSREYLSEDKEVYQVQLLDGMTDSEIEDYRSSLPSGHLPAEINELLKFARGFELGAFEEFRFDSYGEFGFEEMFPHSIPLASDGFGNFWILDVDSMGNWKEVYYMCHDPAVLVKHSENLADFIGHVNEFGLRLRDSHLDQVHEKIVMDIWREKPGTLALDEKEYSFSEAITAQLPEAFVVADLTDKPVGAGFAWGKFGANAKIIRVEDKPIWIIEKKIKRGFLSRLFSRNI